MFADRSSLLNPFSDTADHVNTVVAFYATSLSHAAGRGYVSPNLSSLARWWFDVSSMTHYIISPFGPIYLAGGVFAGELRFAARTLFDAGVASLTDEETVSLVERWQHSRKVFCVLLCPVMTADLDAGNDSALLASRLGTKVSRCLKGFASLRFHCR